MIGRFRVYALINHQVQILGHFFFSYKVYVFGTKYNIFIAICSFLVGTIAIYRDQGKQNYKYIYYKISLRFWSSLF